MLPQFTMKLMVTTLPGIYSGWSTQAAAKQDNLWPLAGSGGNKKTPPQSGGVWQSRSGRASPALVLRWRLQG